jgi:hypothetical protein
MKCLLLYVALFIGVAAAGPAAGVAQSLLDPTGPFLGTWCVAGDSSRRASITRNGPFNLSLTNESGSTSSGLISGPNSRQVTAPDWNLVQGMLSADGKTINWSNNTFWARCKRNRHDINVQGTWYVGGDQSRACRIDQQNGALSLRNETGQTGSGTFTKSHHITTSWSGTRIEGTISRDQNRIDWSNGTYWTR